MQFVDRKMFARLEECPQNRIALFGLLQADAFEMPQENSFGFADVLLRDGRLIVDSFLQHVGLTLKMIMHAKGSNMILGEARIAPTGSQLRGPIWYCFSLVLTTWYPHPPPPGLVESGS